MPEGRWPPILQFYVFSHSIPQALIIVGAFSLLLAGPVSAAGQSAQAPGYAQRGGQALSGYGAGSAHFAWADVLRVEPVYETVAVTRMRRECRDVTVVREDRSRGNLGAVVGAVAGGVLGSTVGGGDGRTAATVVGAVAGGVIGHEVAQGDADTIMRTRCTNVPKMTQERRISSYDVEYRYQGDIYLSRLAYDPGERLRVRVSVTPAN